MTFDDIEVDTSEVTAWRLRLQTLLSGKLDYVVRDVGSVAAWIERQLAHLPDRTRVEGVFRIALDHEVVPWKVARSKDPYYVLGLVQLIGAFTPYPGFGKLVALLEHRLDHGGFDFKKDDDDFIVVSATAALAGYYPTPPPNASTDDAYQRYVKLLARLESDPIAGPSAVHQMLRLGIAKLDDMEFIARATKDESLLKTAVDHAIAPPEPWSVSQLSAVLNGCVCTREGQALKAFVDCIERYDVPVQPFDDHILVTPRDGKHITIRVRKDLVDFYMLIRWQVFGPSWIDEYNKIINEK